MRSNRQEDEDLLVRQLGNAIKEANDKGKMHVGVEEFDKNYSQFESSITLELLKKQVQNGIIGIDNKIIRPTPKGIERYNLDKSFYS